MRGLIVRRAIDVVLSWPPRVRLIFALLFAFIALLVVDLVRETSEAPIKVVFEEPMALAKTPLDYSIRATLADFDFEESSDKLTGAMQVEIFAHREDDEIESLTFSFDLAEDGASRTFEPPRSRSAFHGHAETMLVPDGPRLAKAEVIYEVTIAADHKLHPLYYPFDRFSFSLAPQACVNNPVGSCYTEDNANVDSLQVPALRVDFSKFYQKMDLKATSQPDGSILVTLRRDSFIRMISIYFALVVTVIIWHILKTQEPRKMLAEALGAFAALWGLRQMLVPNNFEQFPTLVDYAIFLFYSVLFAVVVVKLQSDKGVRT